MGILRIITQGENFSIKFNKMNEILKLNVQ